MNAPWPLDDRMTVSLFAGMGGACDGLEDAGFPVHLAINHDPVAVAVHAYRHKHTRHLQQDVFEADPRKETKGRKVRMLWASPDCTHFSVAKGSKPVSKRRRSLAWVVCRWAGQVRPETIGLENVWEITSWGPLIAKRCPETGRVLKLDGSVAAKGERVPVQQQQLVPDPRHKGRIWKAFVKHLEKLGGRFEYRKINMADHGIRTIRTRLFGICVFDDREISWPERTHAPRDKCKALGLKPWNGMDACIDWSLPMKSIFDRDKPLADATLRRIARGIVKFVIEAKEPFIVPICQTGGSSSGRPVSQPGYTATTAKGGELMLVSPVIADTAHGEGQGRGVSEWPVSEPMRTVSASPGKAVVAAHMVRQFGNSDAGDVREPSGTITAGGGGKSALVAAFLAKHYGGVTGTQMPEPLPTLTTGGQRGISQQGVVAAALTSLRGTKKGGSDVRDPMPTQSAGGNHEMLITPFLQAYYSSGGQHGDVRDPSLALTGRDRHSLVCVEVDGETFVITDILMRMLDPMEGARAHGFDPDSFPKTITIDGKEKPLTKTAKGHLVGNSVPKDMVRMLAELNVPREMWMEAAE